ncbi:hypothetical protein J8273_1915 [Carpediemonas membranifera]|uniref:Uncharacterized protein n=1 Tax=Carpediemonas membranifera TaxID=201153 RepID=A0A8J6AXY5_9EUKA|nr:hypothetical protein J8273_1915 [Carpediemonas membranifera]|eukprot:KAG9396868.1 hypothetical protein J8273_1915 [Carpediemonas membranifera]
MNANAYSEEDCRELDITLSCVKHDIMFLTKCDPRRDELMGNLASFVKEKVTPLYNELFGDITTSDARKVFIEAHNIATTSSNTIANDVPALIRRAFRAEFGEEIPSASVPALQDALRKLGSCRLHNKQAIRLLHSANLVFSRGPELSMNIELGEGEDLPVKMHTLLQGTIWAILMQAGADPDIDTRPDKRMRDPSGHRYKFGYTERERCLWFLCKKFFFSHQVAEKDCDQSLKIDTSHFAHRLYFGRFFKLSADTRPAARRYTWMRLPPVIRLYRLKYLTFIAVTPRGLYGYLPHWRWRTPDFMFDELHPDRMMKAPAHIAFTRCPAISEYEASLPVWHKDRVATDIRFLKGEQSMFCVILTPVGVAVSGEQTANLSRAPGERRDSVITRVFRQVRMPGRFIPDQVTNVGSTILFGHGSRQMIGGDNSFGKLGIGDEAAWDGLGVFPLPFRVDRVFDFGDIINVKFHLYLSGRQILFAGEVPPHLIDSGLLTGFEAKELCRTATPLRFPKRLIGFYCTQRAVVCVYINQTVCHVIHRTRHRNRFLTGLLDELDEPEEENPPAPRTDVLTVEFESSAVSEVGVYYDSVFSLQMKGTDRGGWRTLSINGEGETVIRHERDIRWGVKDLAEVEVDAYGVEEESTS